MAHDTPPDPPPPGAGPGQPPAAPRDAAPPQPVKHRRIPVSIVWLVPLVAALVALSLLARSWSSLGPRITISLQSAAGLEAGKSTVRYKDVVIGKVTSIRLSRDTRRVEVGVTLDKQAEAFTARDARYWIVRPRVGIGGVSGIDTLLSGTYIAADVGSADEHSDVFVGLEAPPAVISGAQGRLFVIEADDMGSLDVGSPLYFRRVRVGQVASYKLDPEGHGIEMQVFVEAPHDRQVRVGSRFWNASGVDLSVGADGLKLNTQSLATIVAGGIAFSTPVDADATPAAEGARFELEKDEKTALAPPDGVPQFVLMRFDQAVRGLAVDAPVEFQGLNLGRVVSIRPDYEPQRKGFPVLVGAVIHPQRLSGLRTKLGIHGASEAERAADFLRVLVEHGMRARLRTGNLLTGQLYVSLDIQPKAPRVAFDPQAAPLTLPTVEGGFDKLQDQVGSIVAKLDRVPFESIGRRLDASLLGLEQALAQVRSDVLPGLDRTLVDARGAMAELRGAAGDARGAIGAAQRSLLAEDAPMQQQLILTLTELRRSARSLRDLSDLLGRQPQSLLRGLPPDAAIAPAAAEAPAEPRSPR